MTLGLFTFCFFSGVLALTVDVTFPLRIDFFSRFFAVKSSSESVNENELSSESRDIIDVFTAVFGLSLAEAGVFD
jgi:hypothetical protein